MKRNIGLLLICIALLIYQEDGLGQQMSLHSQFLMNEYLVNPAVAGYDGYSKLNLSAREQWLGIPQAPKTHSVSFQTRLLNASHISRKKSVRKKYTTKSKLSRVGLGAMIIDDRTGPIARTGVQFTYAYHIPFKESQLSFGISAEGYQFRLRKEDIHLYDEDDPYYLNYDFGTFIPDANFGAYYLAGNYNFGFSIYNLFQSGLKLGNTGNNDLRTLRHYYLTGGYKLDISRNFYLHGYTLIKSTNKFNSVQADLSVTAFLNESYWLGLSYRTTNTLIIKIGFRIDNFYFGYAFDHSFNSISSYTYGSHEITATVKFGSSARRYRWLNHDLF